MKKVPLCASSKRMQSTGGTMENCTYTAVGSSKLGAASLSHSLLSDLRSPKQCKAKVSFAIPLISVSNNFMKDTSQPSRVPWLTSPWVCLLSVSLLTFYATPMWASKWGLCLSGFNHIMPFCSFLLPPQFQTCQLHWQYLASMDSIRPSRLMTWMIFTNTSPQMWPLTALTDFHIYSPACTKAHFFLFCFLQTHLCS